MANNSPPDKPPVVEELHRGQLRMAERMVAKFGAELRHAKGLGWYTWDTHRWKADASNIVYRAADRTLKASLRALENMHGQQRNELYSDVRKCESAAGVEGMVKLASYKKPIAIEPKDFDADPYLFNVHNGTFDLHTGKLRPHASGDLITKIAGCGYETDAHSELFERFITEILPDTDVRLYVQRLFGLALLGRVREHILALFTGREGHNGKTTLIELAHRVFGDYGLTTEPELLIETRNEKHSTGIADLRGIRLATTTEIGKNKKFNTALVRRLTGGDSIRARRMRQDHFEFEPSHTLIMATNDLPKVVDDEPATWRRMSVVPFDLVIPDDRVDKQLGEKLALELPAVLRWIFDGWLQYSELGGLKPPDAVLKRTRAYKLESDTLARFLAEKTFKSETSHYTGARQLWEAYKRWTQQVGEQSGTEREFSHAMETHGLTSVRAKIGMVYRGTVLLTEADSPLIEDDALIERERYH